MEIIVSKEGVIIICLMNLENAYKIVLKGWSDTKINVRQIVNNFYYSIIQMNVSTNAQYKQFIMLQIYM